MEHKACGTAATALAGGLLAAAMAIAQPVEFKIQWSTVGEVAAGEGTGLPKGARVARVDVNPPIVETSVGKQVCISSLQIDAFDAQGRPVAGAPLTIVVRADHEQTLQLARPRGDICMRPAYAGEYPIRFTSKLPAADGSLRGAQVFLRVS